jgi:hypothetical protein
MDKTQFGTIGFSQMVDGGCFAMTSAALTVNFVVFFAKSSIAADDII